MTPQELKPLLPCPVTAPGQIRDRETIIFNYKGEERVERAILVLNRGTEKEEIVYNKRNNQYFILKQTFKPGCPLNNVRVLRPVSPPAGEVEVEEALDYVENYIIGSDPEIENRLTGDMKAAYVLASALRKARGEAPQANYMTALCDKCGAHGARLTNEGAFCLKCEPYRGAGEPASDYDRAVEALAPYLPDGWIAQDEDGGVCWFLYEPKARIDVWLKSVFGSPWWKFQNVPRLPDWRLSLRRIQSGRVVPATQEGGRDGNV